MSNTLRKFQYILEGIDQEHLTDILVKRLKSRYPDISTKYEEDVLHDAAMDVASFHAGAEELGTSDIGAMIREVIKNLERFNERGQGEKMIPNSVRGWRMNEETEPERVVRQLKAAKKYLGQDPEPKEPEEKETNESFWKPPSPAQLRFNRALERERKKSQPDREKFQKELDRIMPPPKKPDDTEKQVTEKTSPEIFNRPKNAPIFSTKPEKIGNYIFDASEFEGSMVYGKDAKGLIVKAYDPKTMDVIGSASFVLVRKKGKNGDSWLESDETKVQEKYRGKGIATAMYQYAKNLGNDIKPSPYKSSAGSEMWKAWGRDVFEDDSSPTSGKTSAGYIWKFEAGREVPWKSDVEANTFIRVTDPTDKTVAGVWADVAGDSLVVEYSQVFDEELRGRGLYTDLLKSLSKQYDVTSDTDTNNAAVSIYKRLGADYDARQAKHTLRKQGVEEGSEQSIPPILYHATYKPRLKNIKLKGLGAGGKRNWEDSKRGVVYLALDPYVAESYAETSDMVPDEWLDQIVILKISTAGLDPNKFQIDSNVQDNEGDTIEYHGVIPLKNISLYKQGVAEGKLNFEEGDCPIFAIALHRLSKMPLMALVEYDEQMNSTVLIHAYVKLDDRWRLDASGETDVDWMLQKYPNNGHAEEIEISEKDLLELGYGKSKCPTLQQVLPHAKEVLQNIEEGQQSVAESFGEAREYHGIMMSIVEGDDGFKLTATSPDGKKLGFVEFSYDTNGTIRAEELEVYEKFRGQGIAKTMYDYVKEQGFTIARSSEQTPDGAAFWDKNKPNKKIWEQGVAEDEHAPQPRPRAVGSLKTMVDVGGIQLNVAIDGSEVSIRPIVDGYQAGYVVFDRDGNTLVPADLAIDEQFRGQGIAKTMYDYVKNLGFTIRRSSDQTKDGKHFWDKNRGEGSQVWEGIDYMAGHCHVMAIALQQLHPDWQLRAHIGWDEEAENEEEYRIDHVYIVAPDGTAYDCRGKFANEEELVGPDETNGVETQYVDMDIQEINNLVQRGELKRFTKQEVQKAMNFIKNQEKELDEACWKGYHKEGMKTMFGKKYPNCVKNTNEDHQQCPECGGPMFSEELINEKKDACYYKVKSRYKVWPSAYASGALVQCRKKGASNWGTKSESSILEGIEQIDENLHKWFKEKWVRFGPDGKIRGACARGDDSEGKPKCLPQSKAHNLGKKGRASAAARKRREDPNPERSGKAINVATKKKTSESSILQGISETKGLPMPGSYEQENKPFLRKGGQKLMALTTEQEELDEKWSDKYKRSIDCNNPKGFSQRAHCQGRKKK